MTINVDKPRDDIRYENRKFLVQALTAAAALPAAGAGIATPALHLAGKI